MKLASCKSALTPPRPPTTSRVVYSTDRFYKAVVPVLVLLFVALWFMVYSTRRFFFCLALCYFVLVFFSPLSIAITSLGEERATVSVFRTFVRFALVGFVCLLSSWCLRRGSVCDCGTPWTFLFLFFFKPYLILINLVCFLKLVVKILLSAGRACHYRVSENNISV